MGARVKMNPQVLTSEMLLLIEAQADGAEVFTLPGDVAAQMARLARRALAVASPKATLPHPGPSDQGQLWPVTRKATVERTALLDAARQVIRFLSLEQRDALRVALVEAL